MVAPVFEPCVADRLGLVDRPGSFQDPGQLGVGLRIVVGAVVALRLNPADQPAGRLVPHAGVARGVQASEALVRESGQVRWQETTGTRDVPAVGLRLQRIGFHIAQDQGGAFVPRVGERSQLTRKKGGSRQPMAAPVRSNSPAKLLPGRNTSPPILARRRRIVANLPPS